MHWTVHPTAKRVRLIVSSEACNLMCGCVGWHPSAAVMWRLLCGGSC